MRPVPSRSFRKAGARSLVLIAAGALCCFTCISQAPPGPDPQPAPYVLHAYTDLLRVPALVVDRKDMPLGSLNLQSFQLQIDSGPRFRPTAFHMEDNEPLNLALVLDASGAESDLLKQLPLTPGNGLPTTLLPHDTYSVYAFDCHVIRSARAMPYPEAATRKSVTQALDAPVLFDTRGRCHDRKRLWDAMQIAADDLAAQPGWRIMLVLSDGEDSGSSAKWATLRDTVIHSSIAIFSLHDRYTFHDPGSAYYAGSRSRGFGGSISADSTENLFAELVGRSGGEILPATVKDLGQKLDHVLALVRSRYILQFSRPLNMESGLHHLDVHTSAHGAIVLASGVSVPARDPSILRDPTTVPTDASKLPVPGNRKPMKP
jgi:hypothetical protein